MDYEVFLVSRIREYWLAAVASRSGARRTTETKRADNDESVALGLARTGRVVTAAALVMSISFAALIAAQVSFMRMFGTRPDPGGAGRRHAGADGAGAGVHARAGPMELVGAQAAGVAARAVRHQRVGLRAIAGAGRPGRRAAPSTRRTAVPASTTRRPHVLPRRSPMVVIPPTDSLRRRRAPRGSGDLLRDEILDAATELLLDTGHAKAVSIRSVAERVGVTPPSIYLHFQDKDALLDAVCARYFDKLDEEMQRVSAGQSSHRGGAARPGAGLRPVRHRKPRAVPDRHDGRVEVRQQCRCSAGQFGLRAHVRHRQALDGRRRVPARRCDRRSPWNCGALRTGRPHC